MTCSIHQSLQYEGLLAGFDRVTGISGAYSLKALFVFHATGLSAHPAPTLAGQCPELLQADHVLRKS